jgi:cysteinyl-tRNA synthetase
VNYTQRALEEASDRVYYLYQTLIDTELALSGGSDCALAAEGESLLSEIYSALSDDLNTPVVIASLSAPLKTLNDLLHTKKGRKQADRQVLLQSNYVALREALSLLGLLPTSISQSLDQMKELALVRAGMTEPQVASAIEERAAARAAKDFVAADEVRKKLEAVGIMIMDTPHGTTWKPGPRLDVAQE